MVLNIYLKGFILALIEFNTKVCLHSFIFRTNHEKWSLMTFFLSFSFFFGTDAFLVQDTLLYFFFPVKSLLLIPRVSIYRKPACLMKTYKCKQQNHFQEAFMLGVGEDHSVK